MLDRLAGAFAATAAGAVLFGLGLAKFTRRDDDWTSAARRTVPTLLGLAGVTLGLILLLELDATANHRPVPISTAALAVTAATLVMLAAASLVAALVPGRDPLGLSEQGRMAYVYAAEALVGALGAHIRLTMPWLFSGWFLRYWPLLLMGVSFAGVGLSEVFPPPASADPGRAIGADRGVPARFADPVGDLGRAPAGGGRVCSSAWSASCTRACAWRGRR